MDEYDNISNEVKTLWSALTNNVSDFSSWTSLLSIVEKDELPREASRFIFDTYLKRFSLCFGYWKKFADLEKKWSLDSRSIEIYEKGVLEIPLSVDLWMYYINHSIQSKCPYQIIQNLYKRAVEKCGGEFKSDKLWDAYIDFERQNNQIKNCLDILLLCIKSLTQSLPKRFDDLRKIIESNPLDKFVDSVSFDFYKNQYNTAVANENIEIPFDEFVRGLILQSYRIIFDQTMIEYNKRLEFENLIKRPYFHIKSLDEFQILNWHRYIDFEIQNYVESEQSIYNRVDLIFERCLIPCAHYEDFWLKAINHYKNNNNVEKVKALYAIVCTKHLIDNVQMKVDWSNYIHSLGDVNLAKEILESIEGQTHGSLLARMKLINMIRVTECTSKVDCNGLLLSEMDSNTSNKIISHLTEYLESAKGEYNISFYAIKLSDFLKRYLNKLERIREVFWKTIGLSKGLKRVYLQFFDFETSKKSIDFLEVKKIVDAVFNDDSIDSSFKKRFLQRYLQVVEDNCFSEQIIEENLQYFNEKIKHLESVDMANSYQNNSFNPNDNSYTDPSLKRQSEYSLDSSNNKVPCNTNQTYEQHTYGQISSQNQLNNVSINDQWAQYNQTAYYNWYQQYGNTYNPNVNQ